MFGLILGSAILALFLWLSAKKGKEKAQPKGKKQKSFIDWLLTGGLAIFLLLVFRVGWAQAFCRLQYLVWTLLPFLRRGDTEFHPHQQQNTATSTSSNMTSAEAARILGIEETASEIEIQKAYKQLMVKLHPDMGGNSYLAGKLNEARDCLLHK
jgi:hypothetical protein